MARWEILFVFAAFEIVISCLLHRWQYINKNFQLCFVGWKRSYYFLILQVIEQLVEPVEVVLLTQFLSPSLPVQEGEG